MLSIDRGGFDQLVARRFRVTSGLDDAMDRADLLTAMPLFTEVSSPQVRLIASKLLDESYPASTNIVHQGEVADKFYVIKSGTVEVRRHAEETGTESTVARLGRGEYFGEIALLMNVPRTASVIAETDVELLSLDTASFEELVRSHLHSNRGLEQVSSRRMIQLRRTETPGYREAA